MAVNGEGFRPFLGHLATRVGGELLFGDKYMSHRVAVDQSVSEMIQLVNDVTQDRFTLSIHVMTNNDAPDPYKGIGILAAARDTFVPARTQAGARTNSRVRF